jgi:hypothetical protein
MMKNEPLDSKSTALSICQNIQQEEAGRVGATGCNPVLTGLLLIIESNLSLWD